MEGNKQTQKSSPRGLSCDKLLKGTKNEEPFNTTLKSNEKNHRRSESKMNVSRNYDLDDDEG